MLAVILCLTMRAMTHLTPIIVASLLVLCCARDRNRDRTPAVRVVEGEEEDAVTVALTPRDLSTEADRITSTSIYLTWLPPRNEGQGVSTIKEYRIQYRNGSTTHTAMTQSPDPKHNLTGLVPNTQYQIWVVPFTTQGEFGKESNTIYITTASNKTPSPDTDGPPPTLVTDDDPPPTLVTDDDPPPTPDTDGPPPAPVSDSSITQATTATAPPPNSAAVMYSYYFVISISSATMIFLYRF